MKIERKKSLDLFENGNYIDSFENLEGLEKYFIDKFEYKKSFYWSNEDTVNDKIIKWLNDNRYHIIESEKLSFVR